MKNFEIITEGLSKVKEYKEGLITFVCRKCNHVINKSKTVENKNFKCLYCGESF
jgi:transcription initiation factor IIE alpha subunit